MDLRIFFISFTCYIHSFSVDPRTDIGFLAFWLIEFRGIIQPKELFYSPIIGQERPGHCQMNDVLCSAIVIVYAKDEWHGFGYVVSSEN